MYIPDGNRRNRYDKSVIEQVRRGNDLAEVVSNYVKLKKSGSNLAGLCPFHTEKTASFYLYRKTQRYHCFGCDAKGDVFDFVMAVERVSFPEAVRQLAARIGFALTPPTDAELRERDRRKAVEPEARQLMAYRRAMLDALLNKRAQCFDKQASCLRVILNRAADSPTARRATVVYAIYDQRINDLETAIDRIKRARWEDLVTSLWKSGWRSAQPLDPHTEDEQLTAAVVGMAALAQQRDKDVPHIPIDPNDRPQHVSPHQARRITEMVAGYMAQMTVAHTTAGGAK